MQSVKDIVLKAIDSKSANNFVKNNHYSGKVVNNSKLHFGCFLNDRLHGVISLGPSLDKKRMMNLVEETKFNEFVEINRMAFDRFLPRNSESRCLGIMFKILKKKCPHIKWIITFADATRCGDGCIYRASGFKLIGIKLNTSLVICENNEIKSRMTLTARSLKNGGKASMPKNTKPLLGHQIKYIYFLKKECEKLLTVPILPFSDIKKMGAEMYKGQKIMRESNNGNSPEYPSGNGVQVHSHALLTDENKNA